MVAVNGSLISCRGGLMLTGLAGVSCIRIAGRFMYMLLSRGEKPVGLGMSLKEACTFLVGESRGFLLIDIGVCGDSILSGTAMLHV